MSHNLLLKLFVQIMLIKSLTSFQFFDDTIEEGDTCEFNATTYGICTLNCLQTEEQFGIDPTICSINDGNILYCCIEDSTSQNDMEKQNVDSRKSMDESQMEDTNQKFYFAYDSCPYNDSIEGVCREQCPNFKFPKYKLLLTENVPCPVLEGFVPLECCVNQLQIAYAPEIFNLNNTFEEGDFCPYDNVSIGICRNFCRSSGIPHDTLLKDSICSYKPDGTPIYCCPDDYNFSDREIVPYSFESDTCIQQHFREGVCRTECTKFEIQRFGTIPTMCPHEPGKQPLFCCPNLNIFDELEKYKNASSGRKFYEKCLQYHPPIETHSGYVAGGSITDRGAFPHMAAIGWTKSDGTIEWNCGGSLISYDYVMTAAHCTLDSSKTPPDVIRIGAKYLDPVKDLVDSLGYGGLYSNLVNYPKILPQNFTISKIIKHPDYSFFSTYNDIALIKLNQSVTPTSLVRPACLWNEADNMDDELQTIALGYGSTEYGGANARKLLMATLTKYTQDDCVQFYKKFQRSSLKHGIVNTQLCVGDPKGVLDTCQGDSGGPLEYLLNYAHYVYGITSVGQSCPSVVPGIYTKVSKYLDWIESIVWPNQHD